MTIEVSQKLPDATFKAWNGGGFDEITTSDLCAGKTVAIFAVPGAFTPTCHAKHLPSYIEHAAELKAKGVDTIACVSVNDAFVLDAWAKAQNAGDDIKMLSDWNGEFTKAIGLDIDLGVATLGLRSKRYSMLVKDGVVASLHVEASPPEMEVSDAKTLLGDL
jgi:peroxiredoxin